MYVCYVWIDIGAAFGVLQHVGGSSVCGYSSKYSRSGRQVGVLLSLFIYIHTYIYTPDGYLLITVFIHTYIHTYILIWIFNYKSIHIYIRIFVGTSTWWKSLQRNSKTATQILQVCMYVAIVWFQVLHKLILVWACPFVLRFTSQESWRNWKDISTTRLMSMH